MRWPWLYGRFVVGYNFMVRTVPLWTSQTSEFLSFEKKVHSQRGVEYGEIPS